MALQAHSFAPPPVYSHGDVAIGHPVLPLATEPPAPGHSQLVTDDRRIVQQKMKGSSVIVCCPQCGHTGPARVTKVCSSLHYAAPHCRASQGALRLPGDVLAVPAGGCASATCPHFYSLCWCPETFQQSVQGSGFMTFFTSGLLCFLGCCPLAIFPFCCDCTKDWIYSCSVCGTLFGRERP